MASGTDESAQNSQLVESEVREFEGTEFEVLEQTLPVLNFDRKLQSLSDIDIAATFDLDLKLIFKKYETHSNIQPSDRTFLCKSLVKCFLLEDTDRKMRKADFERISSLIAKRFPTESAVTYYLKASKKKRACGKLYDTYLHLRCELIKAGLATKSAYKKGPTEDAGGRPVETDDTEPDENQVALDIEFLEAHAGPWDNVTDAWYRTSEARRGILKGMLVSEYINNYPALYTNRGLELLAIDTNILHPNLQQLAKVLEELSTKLMDRIRQTRPYPFTHLLTNPTQAVTNALILVSLPYLMPAAYSRVNNKSVRLSKAEVSSRFFPYFTTKAERDNFYENLVTTAERLKAPLAPSIHMFGNFDSPMCVVTIERQPYFIDNPITAFDFHFKAIFALGLKYPEGSEQVWLFVQKKLYGLVTDQDPTFPAVETLMNSI